MADGDVQSALGLHTTGQLQRVMGPGFAPPHAQLMRPIEGVRTPTPGRGSAPRPRVIAAAPLADSAEPASVLDVMPEDADPATRTRAMIPRNRSTLDSA